MDKENVEDLSGYKIYLKHSSVYTDFIQQTTIV
jgi:hypothetical protein